MRALARRLWHWLWGALRWRFRIPRTRWRVPLGAVLGGLIVVVGSGAIVTHETKKPLFCLSCHEMDQPVRTWRVSSHKDVSCEKCHIMPGTLNMFKSKASSLRQVYLHARGDVEASAIQAHVPDANCKTCHPETRDLIVYHNLKITHKSHWDRGIECTYCHDRVVHGQQAAYKNTPRMETCYKCHDGKQAPNTCSTCHVVLGERRPSTFRPEWVEAHKVNVSQEGESCRRCHQADFCDNCHRAASPHDASWLGQHPKGFRDNPKGCSVCHAVADEKEEMAFCADCHALRREHGLRWLGVHQEEFRSDPTSCARCHEQQYCADCHAIYRQHPENWQHLHPAQAAAKPEGCQVCHTEQYCERCHEKTEPKSHTAQWPRTHGAAVGTSTERCTLCHKPDFCQTCHGSEAGEPKSHDARWTAGHGKASLVDSTGCLTCHASSDCASCHEVKMPHPKDWSQAHRAAAKPTAATCKRCHDESFCAACHRSSRPESHQDGWTQRHGDHAKADRKTCLQCHGETLCAACHRGVAMPHAQDWPKDHGAQAKSSEDRQRCQSCHSQDTCTTCHGVDLPHPEDWMLTHKAKASFAADATCFKCHERSLCATCHPSATLGVARPDGRGVTLSEAKGHGEQAQPGDG